MKVLGIVSEYNPFHNGHLYHLNKALSISEADYSICIMSGNFLQRGEPALLDKWIRAEIAVRNGIDLVLELPTPFACSSAEYFAKGAISILNGLGCITHIAFGSENPKIESLYRVADILANEPDDYSERLKSHLSRGISFPKARALSISEICGEMHILNQPNNILGVEYLKALIRLNSNITPIAIKRFGSDYHDSDINGSICSATAIRKRLMDTHNLLPSITNVIPSASYDVIHHYFSKGIKPLYLPDIFEFLRYKILSTEITDIKDIFSVIEGLEYKITNEIRSLNTLEELIDHMKSKRYTQTSLQRLFIHILLGLKKDHMSLFNSNTNCYYGRILGFSSRGNQLIRHIKENNNNTPLITNINKEVNDDSNISNLIKYDIIASDIYHLISGCYDLYKYSDYVKVPFMK